MSRKRRLGKWAAGELNLVAMIDVAFQLLSFFIITIGPVAVMTELAVARPNIPPPDPKVRVEPTQPGIRITVFEQGYSLNEKPMTVPDMEKRLRKLRGIDGSQAVLIQCVNDSWHSNMVGALDLCANVKLTNLLVVSSGTL